MAVNNSIARNRTQTLLFVLLMIAVIAMLDWWTHSEVLLAFLYLFPMLLAGMRLSRWQIVALALLCTTFAELFDPFSWSLRIGAPRDALYFIAFFCTGLFFHESQRSRQIIQQNLDEIERQVAARKEAEEQLQFLVESSPVAIFITDSTGHVLMANDAAHRQLMLPNGLLYGRSLHTYFPSLVNVPVASPGRSSFRTMMHARALRENGEAFFAEIWFSTYYTASGPRLAAMVMDASEDLRDREETSVEQAGQSSRIAISAVAHEIRNVCGAIAVVHRNLCRNPQLKDDKDFEALGNLVLALESMASMELHHAPGDPTSVDLAALLEEYRIVATPSLQDAGIETTWSIAENLPPVWADRKALMLICLNLTRNSIRALQQVPSPHFSITAYLDTKSTSAHSKVFVEFIDNGPGVAYPDRLFRAFQADAQSTGLGLYLSRAFARSLRGDLVYLGGTHGANFRLELESADHAIPSGASSE